MSTPKAALSIDQLNQLFPFFLIINKNMEITDEGRSYSKLTGTLLGKQFLNCFSILKPTEIDTYEKLHSLKDQLFILQLKESNNHFRGQFIHSENNGDLIFCGSIWLHNLNELTQANLLRTDLAPHDSLFEMLQILNAKEMVSDDIKSLVARMGDQNEQIIKRENKYRELLDNLYDAVVSFDENSNIIECNKALCTITGYSEEELLKMSGKDITYEEDWNIARQSTIDLQEKGFISNFQLRIKTKSGSITDIEISSNAIYENGVYKGSRDIVRDISERKKTEERLRDLSMVTQETSNLIVIADKNRKIEWVNKGFTDVSGYSLEEVLGKKPGEFLQGTDTDPKIKESISIALNKGESFRGTILNYSKDGRQYWNELTINPVKDANGIIQKYISIATDVTELIKKNEELLNSELRWKFAIEGSGDGVFEFNVYQNKFYGTDSLKSLLGFDMEIPELEFTDLENLIHPEDTAESLDLFSQLLNGNSTNFRHELRLMNNNNEYIWILARAMVTKRDHLGMPLIVLGTTTDISHIKETEKELVAAKTEAEKGSEYKNQFLATMSHEIRTPLNAIIGLTNLMLLEKPTGELKGNLSTLSFSANHLLSLINDILDLSKIEAGKIDFNYTDFQLSKLMKGVHETFLQKCTEKNLELTYTVDESIPAVLKGDSIRLIQIMNNLVNNAVKFTDKGSVHISVKPAVAGTNKIRLLFEVKDTGIGISLKHQKDIFDDFVQADSSIVQKYGGTGLGLTIIKKLIELQDGKISVESKPGKGSRFYFELCFEIPDLKNTTINQDENTENEFGSLNGCRVLLVEDIAANQKVAVAYLNHWNAIPTCASNGKEALEMFSKNDYDILLIDLYMPIMNGFDTIKRIRKTKKGKSIPIVALTASAETNTLQKALDCGADLCISKPFNALELFKTISQQTKFDTANSFKSKEKSKRKQSDKKQEFKHINLSIIKDASLGNEVFINEMLELFKSEIPIVLNDCNTALMKKDYTAFSFSIHKLKNSFMMLGMTHTKEILVKLENDSRSGRNLPELEAGFSAIRLEWERASIELKNIQPIFSLT